MTGLTLSVIDGELARVESELLRRSVPFALKAKLRASIPAKLRSVLLPARYKGLHGGRGGMKSWTFARLLLLRCLERPGTRFACIREIQKSLEQSVKRLLEDTIIEFGLGDCFDVYDARIDTPGGGVLIFQGMQNHTAVSIKSLEGFHGAWVEEAQSLSATSLEMLRPTFREEDSELWFSWNPEKATDPVDRFLRGPDGAPPNSLVIETSYQDNPHFPRVLQAEMELDLARDPEMHAHIWRGKYRTRGKAGVFKNWRVEAFETPDDAAFLFGGDWGFSVDPSVLVRLFVKGRTLFVDREAYAVGCEIDDTPALFDALDPARPAMARAWEIIADSARPETISYMQHHGYPRIVAARKGAGSVEEGITFLQNFDAIVIHSRCLHCAEEFADYSYKTHPLTNEVMPILEDKKNHVIDAARYAVEKLHAPKVFFNW